MDIGYFLRLFSQVIFSGYFLKLFSQVIFSSSKTTTLPQFTIFTLTLTLAFEVVFVADNMNRSCRLLKKGYFVVEAKTLTC